eukprot:TRINITY_DN22087_c0_g1_i1.p1 TRINITY_DN22087_c0_g1~~TRINITY_DN22087_c0_g1_i1.p1  ORF type:complete len:565 (+),score=78.52 TRINITY_DN22087_c0_g1_i1:42-1736(+)
MRVVFGVLVLLCIVGVVECVPVPSCTTECDCSFAVTLVDNDPQTSLGYDGDRQESALYYTLAGLKKKIVDVQLNISTFIRLSFLDELAHNVLVESNYEHDAEVFIKENAKCIFEDDQVQAREDGNDPYLGGPVLAVFDVAIIKGTAFSMKEAIDLMQRTVAHNPHHNWIGIHVTARASGFSGRIQHIYDYAIVLVDVCHGPDGSSLPDTVVGGDQDAVLLQCHSRDNDAGANGYEFTNPTFYVGNDSVVVAGSSDWESIAPVTSTGCVSYVVDIQTGDFRIYPTGSCFNIPLQAVQVVFSDGSDIIIDVTEINQTSSCEYEGVTTNLLEYFDVSEDPGIRFNLGSFVFPVGNDTDGEATVACADFSNIAEENCPFGCDFESRIPFVEENYLGFETFDRATLPIAFNLTDFPSEYSLNTTDLFESNCSIFTALGNDFEFDNTTLTLTIVNATGFSLNVSMCQTFGLQIFFEFNSTSDFDPAINSFNISIFNTAGGEIWSDDDFRFELPDDTDNRVFFSIWFDSLGEIGEITFEDNSGERWWVITDPVLGYDNDNNRCSAGSPYNT